MVTHEHELVYRFNHRVVTIDKGTVVADTKAQAQKSFAFSGIGGYDER